jgi:hypothetical protein
MKLHKDHHEITPVQLLKDVPQNELYDFIVHHAQYNPQLKNAILLKFAHTMQKKEKSNINNYNSLLRDALAGFHFDFEDIGYGHYDDVIEIDVLDQWLDKAQEHVAQNDPEEALFICKAFIEEYAAWCEKHDSAIVEYFKIDYMETPFDILTQISSKQEVDCKELSDYCKSEMLKPKYKRVYMFDYFSNLFMKLSIMVGSDDFIALQDKLLQEITDKSSYNAEEILQRKINFYKSNKQPDKADEIVKENLQIQSFREKVTKQLIAENRLQEAKKLITDFISNKSNENRYLGSWYELKLQIAQKENDTPEIRSLSFRFIESYFKTEYYNIYKATFTTEEWAVAVEKLIKHYEKRHSTNWFNHHVADILRAEKQEERLMKYVEKYLHITNLEEYYAGFSSAFPEKTLALFYNTIDRYAQNTGREVYEHIAKLFEKMIKIKGGKELVGEMINQYKILYKNRRAMMEILDRFKIQNQ